MTKKVVHPCPYTPVVLDRMSGLLDSEAHQRGIERLRVLDPFAGTGLRVAQHETSRYHDWTGVELEESFIVVDWVRHGNSRELPSMFPSAYFDAVATSLVFANGMTDSFVSSEKDKSRRHTYSHAARANRGDRTYRLHPDNAGQMGWGRGGHREGRAWREFHVDLIKGLRCVVRPAGLVILELSNHLASIKRGEPPVEIDSIGWLRSELAANGWTEVALIPIEIQRQRMGANRHRVDATHLLVWRTPHGGFDVTPDVHTDVGTRQPAPLEVEQ